MSNKEYDKFIRTSHGQHEAHVCRRADRGEDEMRTFVLDVPCEDINVLMYALAKIVNDPEKLSIVGEPSEDDLKRAEELALSMHELLSYCYERRHRHAWHTLIGLAGLNNATTDTAAALILNIYGSEAVDGEIENDGDEPIDEPHARGPLLQEGTMLIDMP